MPHPIPTLDILPSRDCQQTGSSISTSPIVIVDASANQYHDLLAGSLDSMEVHILNEQEDGIIQILSLLQQYHHLSRLFLLCEGAPSRLNYSVLEVQRLQKGLKVPILSCVVNLSTC